MRNLPGLVIVGILGLSSSVNASDHTRDQLRDALDNALRAVRVAGPDFSRLPIVLTSELLPAASVGVEGWTTYDERGKGDRIFVYTGSALFRCASKPHDPDRQCALKLASIIVHEAWHFMRGPDEAGAYQAQVTFLVRNDGAPEHIWAVRLARERVLATQQTKTNATKR